MLGNIFEIIDIPLSFSAHVNNESHAPIYTHLTMNNKQNYAPLIYGENCIFTVINPIL